MSRVSRATCLCSALLITLALPMATVFADIANEKAVVEGMTFYLGIVPSELVLGHPQGHSEREMHGGPPAGAGEYHVMIAIFDAKTGKRITDAVVKASVESLGLGGQEKPLEPMPIAGALTYGNYFRMAGTGPYTITLRVSRPGLQRPVAVRFEHSHR